MPKTNENAITLATPVTSINAFFGNIDFEKISCAIVNLANHTTLSEVEKTSAMEIIDTWQTNVIDKLKLESGRIHDFLSCIQGSSSRYYGNSLASFISEQRYVDEIEFLVDKVGKRDVYNELIDTLDEYTIAEANCNTTNETQVVIDVTTTVEDEILQRKDLELEKIKTQAAMTKIGNKIARLSRELLNAINSDKEIITALRALKKQETAMLKATTTCVDKAQLAKINVTIDDAKVRDSLAELINFSI